MSKNQKTNPWLIAAGIGCLVLIACALVGGLGWFFLSGPGKSSQNPTSVARFLTPTPGVPSPTISSIASATATNSLVTPSPTVSPSSLTPTSTRPPASPTPSAVRGKIAFSVDRGERPEDKFVWIMNADGSAAKRILDQASSPAFSPDGNLIAYYHWNDGIYVAGADGLNPRKIVGETNAKYLAWSHDGRWIAFTSQPIPTGNTFIDAVLVDGTGRRRITNGSMPSWSFDEPQIAMSTCIGSTCGIYKVNSASGDPVQVTTDAGGDPAWSPDGKRILYQADVDGVKQLFVVNADGSGKRQLTSGSALHVDGQWSSDGNFVFYRSTEGGSWAIWRMNGDGSKPIKLIEDTPPVDWAYEKLAVSTSTK